MNALEVFRVLGIPPTEDYAQVRKAYLVKLKRLQKRAQKLKGTEEFSDVEDKMLELNQAFNSLNESSMAEMKMMAETITMQEQLIPKSMRDQYGLDLGGFDNEIVKPDRSNIKVVLESLEMVWKEKELDSIEETITLNDFMNGALIMMEDNKTIDLPAGFLGVITTVAKDKVRFINIRGKDSVTFAYDPKGNIMLKSIPEGSIYDDEINTLEFSLRDNKFTIDLKKFKWNSKVNYWESKGTGLKVYGGNKKGNFYIDTGKLKSTKNVEVGNKVIDFFETVSKD